MTKISLIPYMGGKYFLIDELIPIINYVADKYSLYTYIEPTGGGARCLLNIRQGKFKYRYYNDGDNGLVSLFTCLQNDRLTNRLIQELFNLEYTREEFDYIKEARKDPGLDICKAAAYTYVAAKFSRAADMKSFNIDRFDKGRIINYFSKIKSLENYRYILSGVECTNLDALDIIKKFSKNDNALIYLDPDYDNESKAIKKDTYSVSFNHERATELLLESTAKVILSGYDTKKYDCLVNQRGWNKYLLKNIPRCCSGKKGDRVDEYIWVNFKIPNYLLTNKQVN